LSSKDPKNMSWQELVELHDSISLELGEPTLEEKFQKIEEQILEEKVKKAFQDPRIQQLAKEYLAYIASTRRESRLRRDRQ